MFDWLAELVRWLHDFIREVPIYVAAPAMILIGTLDSSLLSLPEINDYLVVARRLAHHADPMAFARLQALVAALYQLSAAEFGHILGTFPLIPREERDAAMRHYVATEPR